MEREIRTECTVEIDDVFIVKRRGRSVEVWCSGCRGQATMLTPEDAATLSGTGARSVYRLIELGEIHSEEGPGDMLLVCLHSLLEKAGQDSRAE